MILTERERAALIKAMYVPESLTDEERGRLTFKLQAPDWDEDLTAHQAATTYALIEALRTVLVSITEGVGQFVANADAIGETNAAMIESARDWLLAVKALDVKLAALLENEKSGPAALG